jgi:hypothetical protein
MKRITTLFKMLLCGVFALSLANLHAQPLQRWERIHPEASQALGEWVKSHPAAAHYIFEWDGHHPERSQLLVIWAIEHPGENLAVFHAQHKDWPELDEIERTHKEGMEGFLLWCRNHGPAARALMRHSMALRWAGDHLYKSSLTMEHP